MRDQKAQSHEDSRENDLPSTGLDGRALPALPAAGTTKGRL